MNRNIHVNRHDKENKDKEHLFDVYFEFFVMSLISVVVRRDG